MKSILLQFGGLAIKLKVKIGTKVMLSYLIVLIITFLLTVIISSITLTTILRRNERSELVDQGVAIVEVIKKENANKVDKLNKLIRYISVLNMDSITDADIYILTKDNKLIYRSSESIAPKELLKIVSNNKSKYIISKTPIISEDNETLANVILVSNVNRIERIVKTTRGAIVIALLMSIVIALIIAFIFQRTITKPIKRMISEMNKANFDVKKVVTPINTGDEIEELYHVYENMLHRLSKNADERKRFFQNTSHELKSPLMSIQGYAEAIKDGVVEGDEVNKSLDIIISKSQDLKRIVEEVIYLSKLENEDLEYAFKEIKISKYLMDLVEEYGSITNRNVGVEFEDKTSQSILVKLDTDKFRSAITNILDNGIRYAKNLIKVELSIRNSKACIRIMDDGDGFKDFEQDRIFERFYKGENGQSGLGLAIAQTVVQEHGGMIRADNHISGGAVFEILIPIIL